MIGQELSDRRPSPTDLARSSAADLDLAWSHRDGLVSAAAQLARAAGHDPLRRDCGGACPVAVVGGDGALCGVVDRLAREATLAATAVVPLVEALSTFLAALPAAAEAIRCCRQTAHPSGTCWFTATPGEDGCGEVLRLLHRLV